MEAFTIDAYLWYDEIAHWMFVPPAGRRTDEPRWTGSLLLSIGSGRVRMEAVGSTICILAHVAKSKFRSQRM